MNASVSDPAGTARVLTVVLNYRTSDLALRAAGAALVAMDGIDGELILVDNDSGDGSFEALEAGVAERRAQDPAWARVRVLQTGRNGGFGAGNNAGIAAGLSDGSAPDYIYILNPDAEPEAEAIRTLLDHLEANPRTGIGGSYIYGGTHPEGEADRDAVPSSWSEPVGEAHSTAFRFPSIWSEIETSVKFGPLSRLLKRYVVALEVPGETINVDWVAGASLLLRQTMLDEIGGFDETFFLYFEETDLCLRANRAGWAATYVHESRVSHIGSVSTGMKDWTRVPGYWFDSRWYYFSKNHGRLYAGAATVLHALGATLWRVRGWVDAKARADAGPRHFVRDLMSHALGFGIRQG
jgi:GT2 family glycosyltransferase